MSEMDHDLKEFLLESVDKLSIEIDTMRQQAAKIAEKTRLMSNSSSLTIWEKEYLEVLIRHVDSIRQKAFELRAKQKKMEKLILEKHVREEFEEEEKLFEQYEQKTPEQLKKIHGLSSVTVVQNGTK